MRKSFQWTWLTSGVLVWDIFCFPCSCSQINRIRLPDQILISVWVAERGWVTAYSRRDCLGLACIKMHDVFLATNLLPDLRLEFVVGSNHRGRPWSPHLFCSLWKVLSVITWHVPEAPRLGLNCCLELAFVSELEVLLNTVVCQVNHCTLCQNRFSELEWKNCFPRDGKACSYFVHLRVHWKQNGPKWAHRKLQNMNTCEGLLGSQEALSQTLLLVLWANPMRQAGHGGPHFQMGKLRCEGRMQCTGAQIPCRERHIAMTSDCRYNCLACGKVGRVKFRAWIWMPAVHLLANWCWSIYLPSLGPQLLTYNDCNMQTRFSLRFRWLNKAEWLMSSVETLWGLQS